MYKDMLRSAAGRDRIPTDGLIAHYTMDNISGSTLVDETGGQDGTIVGASQVAGVIGIALSFDGTNDEVQSVGSVTGTTDLTGSLWIKTTQTSTGVIYDQALSGLTNGRSLFINSSGVGMFSRDSSGTYQQTNTIAGADDGNWNHVIFSQIGNSLLVRLNDASEETIVMTGRKDGAGLGNIGSRKAGDTPLWYSGQIDSVRIYNRELDPEEKTQLYNEV